MSWVILPWWGFLVVACYCYFVPFFRSRQLLVPFFAFLALSVVAESDLLNAAYAVPILALILGIKELAIVNRRGAYAFLVSLLSFAAFLLLFRSFAAWSAPLSFLALALVAAAWRQLVLADPENPEKAGDLPLVLATLLVFESGVVIFFLPVNFFYQAALLFFGSVILFEAMARPRQASIRQLAVWTGTYAAIALLVVFLAPWKI